MRHVACLAVLLLLAACGSHPLEGAWAQDTADGGHGLALQFDVGGSEVSVHGPERPDGGHDHIPGSYTFDEATMTVTVNSRMLGPKKSETFTGKVEGARLELGSADGKLTFHRAEKVYGH